MIFKAMMHNGRPCFQAVQPVDPEPWAAIPAAERIAMFQYREDISKDNEVRALSDLPEMYDPYAEQREQLTMLITSLEDLMKVRIAHGNRLYASVIRALGFKPGEKIYTNKVPEMTSDDILPESEETVELIESRTEEQDNEREKDNVDVGKIIEELKYEFKRVTDRIVCSLLNQTAITNIKKAKLDINEIASIALSSSGTKKLAEILRTSEDIKYIKNPSVYATVKYYVQLLNQEKDLEKQLEAVLQPFPVYRYFLKHVTGMGPKSCAALLSRINIYKCNSSASMIAYCGLDVGPDGLGRNNTKMHLVPREYINKAGEVAVKESVTYSPYLQVKLLGVFAPVFMKLSPTYKRVYDNYKMRLLNEGRLKMFKQVMKDGKPQFDQNGQPKLMPAYTPAHMHRMAIRHMMKHFIIDLYVNWCVIEGIVPKTPYIQEKLGMQAKVRCLVPHRYKTNKFNMVLCYYDEGLLDVMKHSIALMKRIEKSVSPVRFELEDSEIYEAEEQEKQQRAADAARMKDIVAKEKPLQKLNNKQPFETDGRIVLGPIFMQKGK